MNQKMWLNSGGAGSLHCSEHCNIPGSFLLLRGGLRWGAVLPAVLGRPMVRLAW